MPHILLCFSFKYYKILLPKQQIADKIAPNEK